jgi:hypothetical protein
MLAHRIAGEPRLAAAVDAVGRVADTGATRRGDEPQTGDLVLTRDQIGRERPEQGFLPARGAGGANGTNGRLTDHDDFLLTTNADVRRRGF